MFTTSICSLDIGSSKIACSVARIKNKEVVDIFFETIPSKGVRCGTIIDTIALTDCVSTALKNLKAKSGINIKSVFVNISGSNIHTKHSHAIIPLADRGNKVISQSDINRVNDQARILGSNLEEEIIHALPFSYTIDSQGNIFNPVGLYSHKLEVDLYLICAKLSIIESLTRVINQAGYEISNLYLSGIATSNVVFDKETPSYEKSFDEGVNLLCDIGSDITEIILYREGKIKSMEILEAGGNSLTIGISDTLKITQDLAEDVKRSYGQVGDYAQKNQDKEILVKKGTVYKPIKQGVVSEIVTNQAKTICAQIKDVVEKKTALGKIDNFVVTGRAVLLDGFLEMLETVLGIPVKVGRIQNPKILSWVNRNNGLSVQNHLTYLTCLGILYQAQLEKKFSILAPSVPTKNLVLKTVNKIKEIYQEYF